MADTLLAWPAEGYFGTFIVREANGYRSREEAVLSAGAGVCEDGTILGRKTAGGEFVPFAPAASDGSQTAAGILLGRYDATTAAQKMVVVCRDCEVKESGLKFKGTAPTAPQITAAFASLTALGVILR